jgi:hypothetical protein
MASLDGMESGLEMGEDGSYSSTLGYALTNDCGHVYLTVGLT